MSEFKKGDVVKLKSGSRNMDIIEINEVSGKGSIRSF
jgi:uncharacterized protein YodC (DUF2158 family)